MNNRYDVQRAYQHLQAENSQLREEIVRLQDKEASEPIEVGTGRAGGHHMMARSSPDGQQDVDREREGRGRQLNIKHYLGPLTHRYDKVAS